jgi:predicted DNA-binding transcriptional regulator AlpA
MPMNLTTKQAAIQVGLSASQLAKLRVYGTGPRFLKMGKAVRYDPRHLDEWVASKCRSSTSEAA